MWGRGLGLGQGPRWGAQVPFDRMGRRGTEGGPCLRELPGGTALEGRDEANCLYSFIVGDGQWPRPDGHPPLPPSPQPVMAMLCPVSQIWVPYAVGKPIMLILPPAVREGCEGGLWH